MSATRKVSVRVQQADVVQPAKAWHVLHNISPMWLSLSSEDQMWQAVLAPINYPGSSAVVPEEYVNCRDVLWAINSHGAVLETTTEYPTQRAFPDYLPSDRWQRAAVVQMVLGSDERFQELVALDPAPMYGNIGEKRVWLSTDYRTILQAAARWLEQEKSGLAYAEQRLKAIHDRLEQIKAL